MDELSLEMELPGFRFHPTEEELLDFYLKNMVLGKKIRHNIIGCLNIYRYDPWDLPGHAKVGEREWYFFVGRETRHGSGRPNRTTEKGFWKATGSDRKIYSLSHPNPNRMIGLKKTLVFYQGRAPHGSKTDWVMNEYRLPDSTSSSSPSHKNIVLCKIYRKATSIKVLEQRAAMEDDEYTIHNNAPIHNPQTFLTINNDAAMNHKHTMLQLSHHFSNDNISVTTSTTHTASSSSSSSSSSLLLSLQSGEVKPSKLELPPKSDYWLQEQDPLWPQLRSPWLLNDFIPLTPLPNLHHF